MNTILRFDFANVVWGAEISLAFGEMTRKEKVMVKAFWSYGQNRETAAIMSLTAVISSFSFPCRIMTVENYLGKENLGYHLLGPRYDTIKQYYAVNTPERYMHGDSFLQHLRRETGKHIRNKRELEIIPDSLYFMPMNQSIQKDVYEYGFEHEINELLEHCKDYYDYLFVNLEANKNISTKTILDIAEDVVVCMPASMDLLEEFCEQYRSLLHKVTFAFCGESNVQFMRRVRKRFGDHLVQGMVFSLTPSAKQAIENGKVIEYLSLHFHDTKEQPEYSFIRKLKHFAFHMLHTESTGNLTQNAELRRLLKRRFQDLNYDELEGNEYIREMQKIRQAKVSENRSEAESSVASRAGTNPSKANQSGTNQSAANQSGTNQSAANRSAGNRQAKNPTKEAKRRVIT